MPGSIPRTLRTVAAMPGGGPGRSTTEAACESVAPIPSPAQKPAPPTTIENPSARGSPLTYLDRAAALAGALVPGLEAIVVPRGLLAAAGAPAGDAPGQRNAAHQNLG